MRYASHRWQVCLRKRLCIMGEAGVFKGTLMYYEGGMFKGTLMYYGGGRCV